MSLTIMMTIVFVVVFVVLVLVAFELVITLLGQQTIVFDLLLRNLCNSQVVPMVDQLHWDHLLHHQLLGHVVVVWIHSNYQHLQKDNYPYDYNRRK